VAVLTFKVRSTSTPLYLRRLIRDRDHVHNLRSATMSLSQPSSRTTLANRAFHCSAPTVWNSLPKTVVDSDSIAVFKSKLKTFLFSQAYSLSSSHSYKHTAWPSASEVTTIWRYTNVYIIIIILRSVTVT